MKHRKNYFIILKIVLLSTVIISFFFTTSCSRETPKPNILFIAIDDLRPELNCYGQSHIISPNIDKLAEEGVLFNRAYCQSAVCNPSRASLLTGMRPDKIKTWDLKTKFRDVVPDIITLPQYFKNNGYHTAGIGKIYHNVIPDPQSWSEPKLHVDGYPFDPDAVYRDDRIVKNIEARKAEIIKLGKEKRYIDRLGEWYIKAEATEAPDVPDNAYFDGAQTDVAIKKLAEFKSLEKPFFLAVGYYRPHLPFNAPKKYWDMYKESDIFLPENPFLPKNSPIMAINNMRELRGYTDYRDVQHPADGKLTDEKARHLRHGYYASVSYIDAQVGKLLAALEETGLKENTIIVLWGDHGWKLGEHSSWAKMTNYEIDTRVPLLISDPRSSKKGIKSNGMVEFVDIYPTLCELAGLEIPEELEGTSMVPLIEGPERKWKKAVFSQFLREGIWISPDGIEYMGYSIRTNRYRYVEWVNWETKEFAARELYDHQIDPDENINISKIPENAALVKKMSKQLKSGWKTAGP